MRQRRGQWFGLPGRGSLGQIHPIRAWEGIFARVFPRFRTVELLYGLGAVGLGGSRGRIVDWWSYTSRVGHILSEIRSMNRLRATNCRLL